MTPYSDVRDRIVRAFDSGPATERAFKTLMYWYGAACFQANVLEMALRTLVLMSRWRPDEPEPSAHVNAEELAQASLGRLVSMVNRECRVGFEIVQQLQSVRVRRNAMVHHFLGQQFLAAMTQVGDWEPLLAECRGAYLEIVAICKVIEAHSAVAIDRAAIPPQMLEQSLNELLPREEDNDA